MKYVKTVTVFQDPIPQSSTRDANLQNKDYNRFICYIMAYS